ncbi:carbohydrate esterase family 1 protein [Patellaria atrata CBS 101060]|uniref:Carbohydrate esterase family 1 protein n=1 Tax=Patellaria atrata CBS 101060 TaxID=1346257 RepID=A0A9P4VN41_9PEZI|nr:carbohydrate esterase family 1 protein [Patellaria atrata CBS 101060]
MSILPPSVDSHLASIDIKSTAQPQGIKSLAVLSTLVLPAFTVQLESVSNWGANPANIQMNIYLPDHLATSPPVILAMHPCGGNAQQYFQMTRLPSYADPLGFSLIYPQTPHFSNCWDCYDAKTLLRNGGGDSTGLAAMVNHTLATYDGDRARVFVTDSSGAVMTSVMASTYPDLFAAGSAFSSVPTGFWKGAPRATPFSAGVSCSMDRKTLSGREWGTLAHAGYPGYNSTRPRMQIWHGQPQWADVFRVQWTQNSTDTPLEGYTEMVYGNGSRLLGYRAQGVGHIAPFQEESVLRF